MKYKKVTAGMTRMRIGSLVLLLLFDIGQTGTVMGETLDQPNLAGKNILAIDLDPDTDGIQDTRTVAVGEVLEVDVVYRTDRTSPGDSFNYIALDLDSNQNPILGSEPSGIDSTRSAKVADDIQVPSSEGIFAGLRGLSFGSGFSKIFFTVDEESGETLIDGDESVGPGFFLADIEDDINSDFLDAPSVGIYTEESEAFNGSFSFSPTSSTVTFPIFTYTFEVIAEGTSELFIEHLFDDVGLPLLGDRDTLEATSAIPVDVELMGATVTTDPCASSVAGLYVVNSTTDASDKLPGDGICETEPGNGICTVRAAVEEANAVVCADTINIPAGTYLISEALTISSNIDIGGAGAGLTILDDDAGSDVEHAFIIDGGFSTIHDISIQNFTTKHSNTAILAEAGTMNINDSIIKDTFGIGIQAEKDAVVNIRRSTISGNEAGLHGGVTNSGKMLIVDSLIMNNNAQRAGGIANLGDGEMVLRNTTVSGNTAKSGSTGAGGILQVGFLSLNNATVTNNISSARKIGGGGIWTTRGGTTVMKNSIVANNRINNGENDCSGKLTADSRYNLIGDTTGCDFTDPTTTFLLNVDPLLDPLNDNGGPTFTHLPMSGSPVINAGFPFTPGGPAADACEGADQRGVIRLICDIGAVQREEPMPVLLIVNSTADATDKLPGDGICETGTGNGICTLRAAVQESNHLPNRQTIEVRNGTYLMTIPPAGEGGINPAAAGDLDLTDDVSIIGESGEHPGPVVNGNSLSRVFHVHGGLNVSIFRLTIQGGNDLEGGGILSSNTSLNLFSVIVEDNVSTGRGGGVFSAGTGEKAKLLVRDSIIRNNNANGLGSNGGGIFAVQDTTIIDTEITSNKADGSGGGVHLDDGGILTRVTVSGNEARGFFGTGGGISSNSIINSKLELNESTVNGNTADSHGGGVFLAAQGMLSNSTISSNTSMNSGGGVSTNSDDVLVVSSTVANNTASTDGSGILVFGRSAQMTLHSSIVYNPGGDSECSGIAPPVSLGGNVAGDASCGLTGPGDQPDTDPLLGALDANGGPTETHLLLVDSPAIDNGADTGVVIDQRGVDRPQGTNFDAGAVEIKRDSTTLRGDLDGDGDVDRTDLDFLLTFRNTPAQGVDDPKDLDGDGMITSLDARKLSLLCTRPRCATN